jgi:hypothetical protein
MAQFQYVFKVKTVLADNELGAMQFENRFVTVKARNFDMAEANLRELLIDENGGINTIMDYELDNVF